MQLKHVVDLGCFRTIFDESGGEDSYHDNGLWWWEVEVEINEEEC